MRIEAALKHFNPKSQQITESTSTQASDSLNSTDVMAAIGMCPANVAFGIHAYLGKAGISEQDRDQAVVHLFINACKSAPTLIRKAAGDQFNPCLMLLAKFAYNDYAHSAADSCVCPDCKGRGVTVELDRVMMHPGCGQTPPKYQQQRVESRCVACHGKGKLSARCRCGGTGKVRDPQRSKQLGVSVEKDCARCGGQGMHRIPSSVALKAIRLMLPELNERTWRRNWKPFYESLVSKCEIEERAADFAFHQVTR